MFSCLSPAAGEDSSFDRESLSHDLDASNMKNNKPGLPHSNSVPQQRSQMKNDSQSSFPVSHSRTHHSSSLNSWETEDSLLAASTLRLRRVKSQVALERSQTKHLTAEQLARQFSQSYLDAVVNGDGTWASSVTKMLNEKVVFVAPDARKFEGKSSVVARLNNGVDQLSKLTAKTDKTSISCKFDLQPIMKEVVMNSNLSPQSHHRSFLRGIMSMLRGKSSSSAAGPHPPSPPSQPASAPLVVEFKFQASYEWRMEGSFRSLKIKDCITISSGGEIVLIKRSMSF